MSQFPHPAGARGVRATAVEAGSGAAGAAARTMAGDEGRAEAAYRLLRQAILTNELPAGFQAAENELATRLGMSRTPVHEAMARLEEEGLVRILPRKGILVRALTPADLLEIYDVLIALEGAAAELLAAADRTEIGPTLAALDDATATMDAALREGRLEDWRAADERFHDAFVAGCGNRRIQRMAATVAAQADRARRLTLHLRPVPHDSAPEHRAIVAAIRAGDARGAGEAARLHRRQARRQLVPILDRLALKQL